MKSQFDQHFFGFSLNFKAEFQRTKDYLLKSSLRSFSTAARSASANSGYMASSYDSFSNTSMGNLMPESPSHGAFEFYSKGKTEIQEIKQEFDKIRQLNKKAKRITFGSGESVVNKINHVMGLISKRISDCETAIKENGAIFSIDKSHKVKDMVSAMQNFLFFELSKVKRQYKNLAQEIAQKQTASGPNFVDNSKFSFISEPEDQSSVIYDSRGNMVKFEEVRCEEDSQYEYIYRNIVELARIMKDFEEVSLDQGCLVDRIDINISATLTTAKKANFELIVADKMLKKDLSDRILKWLLFINLIFFACLMLKVFKPWK